MADRPVIPDLDPRTDAHVIGKMTFSGLAILLGGMAILVPMVLFLVTPLLGWLVAMAIALVLSSGLGVWIAVDGPAMMARRLRWRQRHVLTDNPPGLSPGIPANQAPDPVWSVGGATWAVARLVLPPTNLVDASQVDAWHHRLAQAVRVAAAHGLVLDIRTAQLPGSAVMPATTPDPVMVARWQWWVQAVGPRSVNTEVYLRMGWPDPRRDPAWVHFQSVEQAWRAVPGPGDWQWVSAASAQAITQDAANPAAAYSRWVDNVHTGLRLAPLPRLGSKGGKRRVLPR
ncbi:hypothetical protein [Sulfobacillus sp. hq2]|uniref:hypothetical protein n=1 Tax=Sulfobacillus TaxID=28033 RepID=UPI000CD0E972|nr:hypothetical protein [Sulfobacillus sp. hq2]POB09680.1 hypothetical protein CO251_15870 [Sulfobacillus sp. hq2]